MRYAPELRTRRPSVGREPIDTIKADEILGHIAAQGRPDYATWTRIIAATADAVGKSEALPLLEKHFPPDKPGEYEAKLRHRLERVTAGTLVHLGSQAGWKPSPGPWKPRRARRPAPPPPPPAPEKKARETVLSDGQRRDMRAARIAFDDACDAGELGWLEDELGIRAAVLRYAAHGADWLGLWNGRLCYCYGGSGMKIRGLPGERLRFYWKFGRAARPWRWCWVNSGTRRVLVTEGESDALALLAAELEDDRETVVVASPGTSFRREWAALFSGLAVVLCFDGDTAGRTASQTVADMLHGVAVSVHIWKPFKP